MIVNQIYYQIGILKTFMKIKKFLKLETLFFIRY